MSEPRRIQLSRKKGWRMPENTVKVDRSTRWGNPFRVGDPRPGFDQRGCIETVGEAVDLFRLHAGVLGMHEIEQHDLAKLRGKNLACWCKLGEPCHADVLLEMANATNKQEGAADGVAGAAGSITRPERIDLLAKALCRAKHGNEDMWANYKAMAKRLLSDEFEAVLRKVLQ